MKNPLNYQTTEYDCGPTTLLNAMSYLFRREEIPPDIIKHITLYCLDSYNGKGEFGKNGTSRMAMMFLSDWLNQFGKVKKFPIHCEYLTGRDVTIHQNSKIVSALQQGGAAVVRLRYGYWHYVLLTSADEASIDLFDPYYRKKPFQQQGIEIISDNPMSRNRRVAYELLNNSGRGPYALGPTETREAILLFNTETQKTPANTIEYFI
ncbi:cysteine peptidase family C39 domain-containing protein [Faecalispora anaeroviscerum]|uniref:peptidase C39 n=1 Tax=Faecalispora anaeroviscerum TaxID=2991836 RepID=UPI0024BAAF43|nr:peptidase C39 [Faecalispora anaeroviscerum]